MARAAQQAPPISVGWLIVTLGVAGVPVATYYGYPGMAALWLGIVLAGWAEPRPVFTGPKDRSGAPTPAGPREEKAKRRYFLYSDLRWRMLCPNLDWLPGWPPLAAWFFALAAGVAATLLPTSELEWGWVNAAATFITIAQLAGSRRRTLTPYDPNPGVRFNSLGHIPALRPTVLGAVAAGVVSALVVLVLLGRGLVTWPTVLPGIAYAGAAAVSAALAVCWSQWKNAALESWRARVAARAEWEPRWQVALPNVNKTGAPQLVAHRQLGSLTIDTFDAPPELGARGLIGLKPKVVAAIGGGYSVTILSSPNLDSQGQPMPGTEHPLRVEVITYPSDSPPDVTDPAIDPEEAAYAISSALSHAVDAYGGGGAQFIFIDIEPVHVPPPPDDSPTGWKRLWSTATPAARTAATEESEQSGTEDEVAEGPAPSQGAVWALRYGGMNSITYVRRQYAGMMPAHLGDHVEVLVNDWPESDPHHPGGGRIYVGAITSPSTVYQDEGTIQMLSNIMEEDRWNERWGGVLKTGANQPEPQFAVAKDATLGRTQLHALPFTIKQGEQVGDFEKLEPKLATTLMAAPFVSIVGYPGPGGRPGDRHPQAFEVRWSDGPVPASADRLPPSKTISQVSSTTKAPEHWVLAGQINAAFDNARLARPEVISARPLTRPGGASGHLWQVEMRLYGGVSLSDVRAKMSRIASSLSTPWIQVTPSKQPQCLVMVLGADYRKAKLADPKRSMPYLADLEWQQAWVDANLVNSQGLAPTTIESATLETNEKVQVLDFELPSGITRSRIKGAIEKLKGSTRNEFVEVRSGVHGASSARLLVSREDPMPIAAPVRLEDVDDLTKPAVVPFATGVEGSTISWDLKRDPHLLITGTTGSGKSAASVTLIGSLLARGVEVVVADPTKDAADFRWAEPWLSAMTITVEETAAMMDAVYAEVQRRKKLNGQYGVANYTDLPADVRPRPLVVYLDEFTSLIMTEKVTKPATDDPEALATYQENLARNALIAKIGDRTGRIAREARSAGVSLVLAAQELKSKTLESVPGGETLRGQMSRLALGKMSYGNLMAALKQPDDAPPLGEVVPQGRGVFETNGNPTVAVQVWYDHPVDEFFTGVLTERIAPVDPQHRLDLEPFMPKQEKQTVEGAILSAPGEGAILSSAEPEVTDLGEIDLDLDDLDLSDVELDDEAADAPDPGPAAGEAIDEGETDAPAPPGEDVRLLVAGDDPTAAELGADFVLLTSEPGAADEEFVVPPESLLGHPKLDALSELIETRSPTHLVWVDSEHGATDDMGVPLTEAIDELASDHGCRVLVLAAPDAKAVARFAGITPPALALDTGAGPAFEVEETEPSVPAAPTAPEPSGDEEDDEPTFDVPEPQPRRPEPAVEEFDFESGEDTAPAEPRPTRSEPAHLLGTNEEEFSF